MTKKDYIALSKLFKGLKTIENDMQPLGKAHQTEGLALIMMARMASMLRLENPNFDINKFVAACKKEYELGQQ